MAHAHHFKAVLQWTGAAKGPVVDYETYSREHRIEIPGKPALMLSSDPAFRGDAKLLNPEDLLVASLASCHFLSYVAICARARLQVLSYADEASGTMDMKDGKMRFVEATLRPRVVIAAGADMEKAVKFHHTAHGQCFITNSVNFPVSNEPVVTAAAK
jgi:organic hydroperoxide reductase OsmC/OhrA